jgi:UDP-N-acetylglucosamine--N-acetylmuramyl-(pentapeptide) pyrophosphoryl-undecaprenol N-acetylglucosamine transferase
MAFIGGGSGGHLFPAIATGHAVLQRFPDARFLFLCSRRPVDQQILATPNWPAETMQVKPYVRMAGHQGFLYRMTLIPEWLTAYRSAKRSLIKFQPQVAVGLGASASVPGMMAASHLRIPIALLEQNTIPGKATRLLARRASVTLAGMPFASEMDRHWPGQLLVTGTPVRADIARLAQALPRFSGRFRLLILGGSQGSASVNKLVLQALADEHCIPSDWQIIHQTGELQVQQVSAEYARRGRTATVLSFIPDLPEMLATATLVVSRAGAGTLQELACAGSPSILIPLTTAAQNHQLANAQRLAEQGAAALVLETADDAGLQLRQHLNALAGQLQLRQHFSTEIRCFAHPEAAEESARILCQLAGVH